MTDAELLSQLAPPIAPPHISWWPLALGWWAVLAGIFLLMVCALLYLGKRWPWWRWPRVWRARKHFLSSLPEPLAPGHALNQWIRIVGRDGLGLNPTLSSDGFVQALPPTFPPTFNDDLISVLEAAYQPQPTTISLSTPLPQLMRTLCHTCLTLHSPGLG